MSFVVYHTLCAFCLLFFSLYFETAHRNPSAFNEKDSKIENLSRALVNHDKMSFLKEKKFLLFFSPWTLSCSLAILIGCTHGKSISDFQNNALIDLKPRSTFNRNIFCSLLVFNYNIRDYHHADCFSCLCSPLCQNDLRLSLSPPPLLLPIFPPLEHIFSAAKNH